MCQISALVLNTAKAVNQQADPINEILILGNELGGEE